MDFWKKPKFILWTLFLILLTVVILQNVEPTSLRFLFWSFLAVPKLVLIVISMAAGAAVALLLRWQLTSRKSHSDDREDTVSEAGHRPTIH